MEETENRRVRVRFAPSPTGPLHIGGVRTALYNFLFARQHKGDFILRIEDTDQNRFVPGAEEYIIEALRWVGIAPNEGQGFGGGPHEPYRQSERKVMYRQFAEKLFEAGLAYIAFDTPEELEQMREQLKASNIEAKYDAITRTNMKNSLTLSEEEVNRRMETGEPYVYRIKLPRKEEVRFHDEIRGWVVVNTSQMDDKVLLKHDGMPTYHLANVVDDYLMGISHVIRGEEWLPSAPLHVLLYRYFGWENVMPKFAHLPLLLKPDGNGKLSKRDGDRLGFPVFPLNWTDPFTHEKSTGYREGGYFPEAVINMLALLGWHPSGNQEVFSLMELIDSFSIEKISKSGAKFDFQKAQLFNQHYLREKSNQELAIMTMPHVESCGFSTSLDYLEKVCGLAKEKVHFIKEIPTYCQYFFTDSFNYDPEVKQKRWKGNVPLFVQTMLEDLRLVEDWQQTYLEDVFRNVCDKLSLQQKDVLQGFRWSLTGAGGGPPVFTIMEVLGKSGTLMRLEKTLQIPVIA